MGNTQGKYNHGFIKIDSESDAVAQEIRRHARKFHDGGENRIEDKYFPEIFVQSATSVRHHSLVTFRSTYSLRAEHLDITLKYAMTNISK